MKNMVAVLAVLGLALAQMGMGCAPRTEKVAPAAPSAAIQPVPEVPQLPLIELPVPASEHERQYLGLVAGANFNLTQVDAQVLIIEVFSMYCPHCQREAPAVNELFESIDRHDGLRAKVRMIGIGKTNTDFEVNLFKEKYQVPFPLFADADGSISRQLRVLGTPTFIALENLPDGSHRFFLHKLGRMGEVSQFLEQIMYQSELREAN